MMPVASPEARLWWVMRTYYVYIMASRSRVLYTGVTNDIVRRVDEHKRSLTPGFTSRYDITRLVYFEEFGDVRDAIAREKQLKGWVRSRKIQLIEEKNSTWEDPAATGFPNLRVHDDLPPFCLKGAPRLVILSERAERARREGSDCGRTRRISGPVRHRPPTRTRHELRVLREHP